MFTSRTVFKSLVVAGLAAGATVVSALPAVQVLPGPYNLGQTIVFSVIDSDPYQMCSEYYGSGTLVCAGDFKVEFDQTLLEWGSATIGGELRGTGSALDSFLVEPEPGEALGVFILVSLLPGDPVNTPTGPTELFSLTFTARAGPTAWIRVGPPPALVDELTGELIQAYDFSAIEKTVSINSAPEPTSSALVALALGAMGFAARRHGRRDND